MKYTYNDMRRQTTLKEVLQDGSELQVAGVGYGTLGELQSMTWAGASQSWAYNNRGQMTSYSLTGSLGSVSHTYQYSSAQNDGKLASRTDAISGEQVVYQYDTLHRLSSATATGGSGSWSQQYVYDGFGNMKQKTGTGLAQYTAFNNPLVSATNNGGATGSDYDMDERLKLFNGHGYAYAPDNKRIVKGFVGGDGNTHRHIYVWLGSMRVGTYDTYSYLDGQGQPQTVFSVVKEDLYLAGRRAAPSDRLGSDLSGGLKLLPYGEELQPPNVPSDRTKFATYHRDANGLDYADQRYYSPGSGRFMTADPYLASGGPSQPGSWNRYAYVGGDPVNFVDPRGLEQCPPGSTTCMEVAAEFINVDTQWSLLNMSLQSTTAAYAQFYGDSSSNRLEGLSGDDLANAWLKRDTLQLRGAALEALKGLQGECAAKIMGTSAKISKLLAAANTANFTYSTGSGSSLSMSYATGGSNTGPTIAQEFELRSQDLPENTSLWGFYQGGSKPLIVVNTMLVGHATEMSATLVHELLHLAYAANVRGGHPEIFEALGIPMPENGASPAWIRDGCK